MAPPIPAFKAHPSTFGSFTPERSRGTADRVHNGFGAFTAAAKSYAHQKVGEHFGSNYDPQADRNVGMGGRQEARSGVGAWLGDAHKQYRELHGNRGTPRERLHSDATKANFRQAVGGSVNDYLQNKIKANKKNIVRNMLFRWAHTQFQSTMRSGCFYK